MSVNPGFTFDDIHSSDFGIVMKSKDRCILPKPNSEDEDIPGYGLYEFLDDTLADRIIKVRCSFAEKDLTRLNIKKHKIAKWIHSNERKKLIFDDETSIYYKAKYFKDVPLEQKLRNARHGTFILAFKCDPYAYSVIDSSKQIEFGQGITHGYGYRFSGPTVFKDINEKTTISVYNWGHKSVRPLIEVIGSCNDLSISANGLTYSYDTELSSEKLEIDGKRYQTRVNDKSKSNNASGNFIELLPGENEITISGTNLNLSEVKIIFEALYY